MRVRFQSTALVALGIFLGGSASAQGLDPDVLDEPGLLESHEPPKTVLAEPKALEPALGRALDRRDGFCKSEDYRLDGDERRLCDLAGSARERCPGFVRACEKPKAGDAAAAPGKQGESSERRGPRKRETGRSSDGGEDRVRWDVSPFGSVLAGIMQALFWALLVVGVGAMLYAAVTALAGRRREPKLDDDADAGGATVAAMPRVLSPGSPEELLVRSRELAMAGALKAAMSLVLRALLRHLEIGGRLELDPARTNGDYVRSLRRQGFDPRELRRVAAEVEAVEFGGRSASPEAFSALHAHVSKLVHVGAVVLAVATLGVLPGCGEQPPGEDTVNSCGTTASGYSVLCEALAERGVKVRRRFAKVENIAAEVERVVVLDDDVDPVERRVLLDWVTENGGTLVLLGGASFFGRYHSAGKRTACGSGITLEPNAWALPEGAKPRFHLPAAYVFVDTGMDRVLARCGDGAFVAQWQQGMGRIVAVSDWRFATNASLAAFDNAALAVSLVASPGTTVELIGYWTGSGSELPAESLSRSGLLPWFLHVLALGLVFSLYKGSPFGSRREPVSVTRRAFAEHALALGDAYARAGASRLALVNFGGWALERLRVRLQATKHGRLSDLASAVAARHGVSESEVMSLVVAVRSAEDQAHDSATEAEHLAVLRRLSGLVKKTGGTS
ncbi:MAG TPA: DUF4129 domain-containing protein [Polyangiaceae bacterium]